MLSLGGTSPVLGIDLGEHSAKYVLISRRGKDFVLEHAGVVELQGKKEDPREVFAKIRSALLAKGFKSFRTVLGVSGQTVFLRFVRLPPVPKHQMDQIVGYEAQQQVPFPIEEVRWDYQVLSAEAEERDVILVAIKNEIVDQLSRSIRSAGLKPGLIDASVLAIVNNLARSQIIHPGTSCLILDIGAKTSHMILADRGALWVRSIPIAGNHVTQAIAEALNIDFQEAERIKLGLGVSPAEAGFNNEMKQKLASAVEKALGRLFSEISRSLGFYRSQYPHSTTHDIYLCGGGSLLKGVDQSAKERFNLPVKRLDALSGFTLGPAANAAEVTRNKALLAGALGLALRPLARCGLTMDLTPHDVHRQRRMARSAVYAAATYLLFLLMGVSYWGYATRLAHIQQTRTQVLQAALEDMESLSRGVYREKEQVETLKGKFQRIEDTLNAAQTWPAVLNAVGQVMPHNFWLVRSVGEKAEDPTQKIWGVLSLEGKTSGDIDRDLPLFREALLKIPFLADVEIASAQVANGLVEFSLKLKVKRTP